MASVHEDTCIIGSNGAQRVGMRLVKDSLIKNTARAGGTVRWLNEGRSVATHENVRTVANKRSVVALQIRVGGEGRIGGENMYYCNILLNLHMKIKRR